MLKNNQLELEKGHTWFNKQGWTPFPFQVEAWEAFAKGESGLVNAPTGSGKTYSLVVPMVLEGLQHKSKKLQAIWIAPIRALSREIQHASEAAIEGMGSAWKVGVRSGDTTAAQKARQKEKPPQFMITTPESLHLLVRVHLEESLHCVRHQRADCTALTAAS